MKTKIALLIACFAVAAGVAWFVYERSFPLSADRDFLRPAAAATTADRRDPPATRLGEALPAVAAVTSEPATNLPGDPAVLRALWADPAFRATSLAKNIADLEARHGRFFLTLADLPPEKLAAIKRLMAMQSMARAELQIPKAFPETPADTTARLAASDRLQRQQEDELRTTLGGDAYLDLEVARHAEAYRDTVTALANGMRARGVALDDTRQERMLEAYTGAMLELGSELQLNPDRSPAPATEAERAARRNRQLEHARQLLARAMGEVLDGPALDAFLAAQLSRETGP